MKYTANCTYSKIIRYFFIEFSYEDDVYNQID